MEETVAERLAVELAQVVELIGDLKLELVAIAESTAAVPDDEHDAEGSTVAYERARVQALLAHSQRRADALEAASRRAAAGGDSGALARCQRCQGPIGAERLLALPATEICVTCAAAGR